MKVLVTGVEHSCTRLVSCLLKIHPDITPIHRSFPAGGKFLDFDSLMSEMALEKVVLVVRGRCGNDLSLIAGTSLLEALDDDERSRLSGSKLGTGTDLAISHVRDFLKRRNKDVAIVSIDALVQHRELALRQTFRLLGVAEEPYDYSCEDKVACEWFEMSLNRNARQRQRDRYSRPTR